MCQRRMHAFTLQAIIDKVEDKSLIVPLLSNLHQYTALFHKYASS